MPARPMKTSAAGNGRELKNPAKARTTPAIRLIVLIRKYGLAQIFLPTYALSR